jgi:hypothetical protein
MVASANTDLWPQRERRLTAFPLLVARVGIVQLGVINPLSFKDGNGWS